MRLEVYHTLELKCEVVFGRNQHCMDSPSHISKIGFIYDDLCNGWIGSQYCSCSNFMKSSFATQFVNRFMFRLLRAAPRPKGFYRFL